MMKPLAHGATRSGQRRGFSLLEVLIATAVLAFGVLGMAQLFLLSISQNRRAAQNTQSSNLLAHRLEQLREADYCWLKAQANTIWKDESTFGGTLYGENMGTNAKVLQGRENRVIGGTTPTTDWVIQRRVLSANQGLSRIDGQPVEGVLLIELRGYRRGVRSQNMAKPKWIYMSAYRTVRSITACP